MRPSFKTVLPHRWNTRTPEKEAQGLLCSQMPVQVQQPKGFSLQTNIRHSIHRYNKPRKMFIVNRLRDI